jgi:D-aminopeptidase
MSAQPSTPRGRVRDILPALRLGKYTPGPLNSLTDVPGVLVNTSSIRTDDGQVNTGVTAILPRKDWADYSSFAGVFRFNGCGEVTGAHWINETGLLTSPVILTNTSAVGDAYRGVLEYCFRHHRSKEGGEMELFIFPVVAETFDGYLSDLGRFAVTPEHVIRCIEDAGANTEARAVPEGSTGGGTGMICHRYKGGTGSSSRLVKGFNADGRSTTYTVAALVQANYGSPENLCVGGIPVGQILAEEKATTPGNDDGVRKDGSIIIVIATDAPLLPVQLQRLATRATVGLAKVGGYGSNTSGDIFLAFSTANKIPVQQISMATPATAAEVTPLTPMPLWVQMTDNDTITGLFEAAADATEEAILNSMFMAESMTGFKERHVDALDLERVKEIVNKRI